MIKHVLGLALGTLGSFTGWFLGVNLLFLFGGVPSWTVTEHVVDFWIVIFGISAIGPVGDWLTYWMIRRWGIQPDHFPTTILGVASFFLSDKYDHIGSPPSGGAE